MVGAKDEAARDRMHRPGTLFAAGLITGEALMGIADRDPDRGVRPRRRDSRCRRACSSASGSAWPCSPWSPGCCIAAARKAKPTLGDVEPGPMCRTTNSCSPAFAHPNGHTNALTEIAMNLRHALAVRSPCCCRCLLAVAPAEPPRAASAVRDMATLDRFSSPTLSPDGRKLVFAQARRRLRRQQVVSTVAVDRRTCSRATRRRRARLTPDGWNVNSPASRADGKTVYFLSGRAAARSCTAMPDRRRHAACR